MRIARKILGAFAAATAAMMTLAPAGWSQDFYEGKTITIIVPYAAGGSYDTVARFAAEHMPRHIPGQPEMIVQNMAGGAAQIGLQAAYNAEPDGLTLIHFAAPVAVRALLGLAMDIDYTKWEWLGSVSGAFYFLAVRPDLGYATLEDVRNTTTPIRIGTLGAGNQITEAAQFLKSVGHYNLQLVPGYAGYNPMSLAVRQGELDGLITGIPSWFTGQTGEMSESGFLVPVLFVGGGLPANQTMPPEIANLPKFDDEITDPKDKSAFQAYFDLFKMTRPFAATPGTPPDRVATLEDAFQAMLRDSEFVAAAEGAGFDISPFSRQETKQVIDTMFSMPDDVKARLQEILSTE